MMKKILNLVFLISLLAMPMVLSSCGDDEPLTEADVTPLMGETWQFEKGVVNVLGQQVVMSYDEVVRYMKEQSGADKIVIVDEKLRFTEKEMIFVNTGDKVYYHYYTNGKFWCEGMDNIVGVVLNMSIPKLTSNQLVFRYKIGIAGLSISMDLFYKR